MTSDPNREAAAGLLRDAFLALDPRLAAEALDSFPRPEPANDAEAVALAFAIASCGDPAIAESVLSSCRGDGTAPPADAAYVAAFCKEASGDFEGAAALLAPYAGAPCTHADRLRLRLADMLLRLKRHGDIAGALGPILDPPGTDHTLEAQCIMLESMLDGGCTREQLIEQVALLDGLLERGFRLTEPENAVYYARLADSRRIEPLVAPLLLRHEFLLDRYEPSTRDELVFLLSMGHKHKVPAAVRAAARAYAREPFPWKGMDSKGVSYLFSSHDEHSAARHTLLQGFSAKEIRKDQSIWGPLVLSSYHAGEWKAVLELLREHRDDIPGQKFEHHARVMRVVCEHHLGRHGEAVDGAKKMGTIFYAASTGIEAAAELLSLAALGRVAEIPLAATRARAIRQGDGEFLAEYFAHVLNEFLIRERGEALDEWLVYLSRNLSPAAVGRDLLRVAELAVEWSMPWGARNAAALLAEHGAGNWREPVMRGLAATAEGVAKEAERHLEAAMRLAEGGDRNQCLLFAARCLRRLGELPKAIEAAEEACADPSFAGRHKALAIRAGILRDRGAAPGDVAALRNDIIAEIRARATGREQADASIFEANQLLAGDAPAAAEANLRDALRREPDNVEVLRLARKIANAFDATEAQRIRATNIAEAWKKRNLGA